MSVWCMSCRIIPPIADFYLRAKLNKAAHLAPFLCPIMVIMDEK